jgi:FtsH-binding integral membrane protein
MSQEPSELAILLSELKDMREEVKTRVEQRNYMTEVMAVLVAGLLTAAFTTSVAVINNYSFFIFCMIPFITAFFMFLIRASYIRHRYLIAHLKRTEQKINLRLKKENRLTFWETSFKETQNTNRIQAYNAFNLGTFLICGFIFSWLIIINYTTLLNLSQFGIPIYIPAVLLILIFWVLGSLAVIRSFIRSYDLHEAVDLTEPPIELDVDELLIKTLSFSKLNVDKDLLVNPQKTMWIGLSSKVVSKSKGLLVITNNRVIFIRKKIRSSGYYWKKSDKPQLLSEIDLRQIISEGGSVLLRDKCKICGWDQEYCIAVQNQCCKYCGEPLTRYPFLSG